MDMQLAVVFLKTGHKIVLRGSPHVVARNIKNSEDKAGDIEIRCSVTRTLNSIFEEDQLWQTFLAEAVRKGVGKLVAEKYQIWRRKATWLWDNLPDSNALCFFPSDQEGMILQIPSEDILKYPNFDPEGSFN